jgi:hypothetical protein
LMEGNNRCSSVFSHWNRSLSVAMVRRGVVLQHGVAPLNRIDG